MNTCKNCRFWSINKVGWGKCAAGKMHDVAGAPAGMQNDGLRHDMLIAVDPSGNAGVSFSPGPDFGCIHHQAKPDEESES